METNKKECKECLHPLHKGKLCNQYYYKEIKGKLIKSRDKCGHLG